jgi:hypothetical protein
MNTVQENPSIMKPEITLDNLDEMPLFHKRRVFMKIFFEIQQIKNVQDSLVSITKSYQDAELVFISRYGGRAYKSDMCFRRTYYYHLNSKNVSK